MTDHRPEQDWQCHAHHREPEPTYTAFGNWLHNHQMQIVYAGVVTMIALTGALSTCDHQREEPYHEAPQGR